jgi:hypothetical protein
MADDHKDEGGGIPETVIFLVGLLAVLGALWWIRGGPTLDTGEGIFVAPLPPVGSGETFGPEINTPTPQEQQ